MLGMTIGNNQLKSNISKLGEESPLKANKTPKGVVAPDMNISPIKDKAKSSKVDRP